MIDYSQSCPRLLQSQQQWRARTRSRLPLVPGLKASVVCSETCCNNLHLKAPTCHICNSKARASLQSVLPFPRMLACIGDQTNSGLLALPHVQDWSACCADGHQHSVLFMTWRSAIGVHRKFKAASWIIWEQHRATLPQKLNNCSFAVNHVFLRLRLPGIPVTAYSNVAVCFC